MNCGPKPTQSGTPLLHLKLISMTTNRDSLTKTMNLKNLLRGKNFTSETKLLRKVLIQNLSLVPILPLFTCSPSMNAERTPELMETERNSMKEVLRFCELKPWSQLGKRSLMNGPKDQKLNSQNGLELDLARKRETQKHLKVRKRKRQLLMRKKKRTMMKKRRRRKKRRNKQNVSYLISYSHPNFF